MNEKTINIGAAVLGIIFGIVTTYIVLKDRMVAEIQEQVAMERDLSDLKSDLASTQADMKEDIATAYALTKSLQTQVTTMQASVSALQLASTPNKPAP